MTAEFRTAPLDPTSTERLESTGLSLGLVDTADAESFARWLQAEARGFHGPTMSQEWIDEQVVTASYRRTTGVWDDTAADPASPVASVSSWVADLTVPGLRSVPAWLISAVTVSPTHRRRGIARNLLESELRTADSLGVPVAVLTVSEATIYGRYGFAPTAMSTDLEINTTRAAWTGPVPAGRLHFATPEDLREDGLALIERVRLRTPGEVQFDGHLWLRLIGLTVDEEKSAKKLRIIRYDDEQGVLQGFAVYSVTETGTNYSAHRLDLAYFVAATDDAYAALWRFLIEMDLVDRIVAQLRPVDEPLAWQVADYRAVATTAKRDHLWARILDVPAALAAREYAASGTIILEVSDPLGFADGVFQLDIAADGSAEVAVIDGDIPEGIDALSLSVNELGALYLGGTSAQSLVNAGRILELTTDAATQVDAAFRSPRAPFLSIWF